MWASIKQHSWPFSLSMVSHALLLGLLVYSVDLTGIKKGGQVQPIKALVVDEALIRQEIDRLKKSKEEKRQREQAAGEKSKQALKDLQRQRKNEEQRLKKIRQQRKREEKTRREQQKAEQQRIEKQKQEEQLRKQKAREAAHQAAIKKQQEAERKRQQAAARKAQEKREAEEKRLQQEKEQVAALKARQREDARIAAAKAEKQAALEAGRLRKQQRRLAGLLSEYQLAIRKKVTRYWHNPGSASASHECRVRAVQIPTGEVIDVNVLSCNGGSDALVRSVKSAVFKASPLPLPKDAALFQRELEFIFRPE